MFSLIITIISIALVAALAVATIYYGGSAFTQGTAKANAAALVSAAQQIAGANTLYQNDNSGTRASLTDITTPAKGYLSGTPSLPAGITLTAIDLNTGVITAALPIAAANVCDAVNVSAGGTATNVAVKTGGATQPFQCSGDGVTPYAFSFKG